MSLLFAVLASALAAAPSVERVLVLDVEADAALGKDATVVSGAIAEAASKDVVVVTSTDLRALSDLAADR